MKTGPSAGGCFGPIEISKPCPQCRKGNMTEFQPMNRILRVNYFESLEVRCPDVNCKQVMKLSSYAKHQEDECQGVEVTCPVEGCDFSCSRGLIAQHIFAEGLDHVEKLTKSHLCLLSKAEKNKKNKGIKQVGGFGFGGGRPSSVSPSVASDDD
jgi:hypothetical protein